MSATTVVPSQRKSSLNLAKKIFLLCCAAPPVIAAAILTFNSILNDYFRTGAYLLDTSWLGSLVYHPHFLLQNPLILRVPGRTSYFYATHFSPIHFLIGLPTYLIDINPVYAAAAYFALVYTFLTFSVAFLVYKAAVANISERNLALWGLALLFTPAMFFFSGPVLMTIGYPHYEVAFAGFGVLLFFCVAQKRFFVATIVGILAVLTREDFGLQLTFFFFVWLVFQKWFLNLSIAELRPWIVGMVAVCLASILIFIIQKTAFPGDSAVSESYLGSPPLAHVTVQFLIERLRKLPIHLLPLSVCFASTALVCLIFRDLRFALGYLACVPWLLVSILAVSDAAGTLSLYYSFPLLFAMTWPLLMLALIRVSGSEKAVSRSKYATASPNIVLSAVIIVLLGYVGSSIVKPVAQARGWLFHRMRFVPEDIQQAGLVFQKLVKSGFWKRNDVGIGIYVGSLAVNAVRHDEVVWSPGRGLRFRAVVFFDHSYYSTALIDRLIRSGYTESVRFGASEIYVAAPQTPAGEAVLEKVRHSSEFGVPVVSQSYLLPRMFLGPAGIRAGTDFRTKGHGLVLFGPYLHVSAGNYLLRYTVQSVKCSSKPPNGVFKIGLNLAEKTIVTKKFDLSKVAAVSQCTRRLRMRLAITGAHPGAVEFPIWYLKGSQVQEITDISLTREN